MYSVVVSDNGIIEEVIICKNEQEVKIVVEDRSETQTSFPIHIVKTVSFEDVAEKYNYIFKDKPMTFDKVIKNVYNVFDEKNIRNIEDKNEFDCFFLQDRYDTEHKDLELYDYLKENLQIKFFCSYRGGEIEEIVFAKSESDAFDKVYDVSLHHSDFWTISESE